MSKSTEPSHLPVVQSIERSILQGQWKLDDILPTDDELAEQFRISRYAAREAYAELVRRNLVRRVRRRGTIVTYRPDAAKPVRKIGLILISDVPSNYIFEKGVAAVAGDRGAGLRVYYHYNHEPNCAHAIEDALRHDVQGLIVTPPPNSSHAPFRDLAKRGFPVVLAFASNPEVPSVFPDDHQAGLLIGRHLGECGYKHPAVVTDDHGYARLRLFGFREGIAGSGVRVDEKRIVPLYYATEMGKLITDLGRMQADSLLEMNPRPDCVFAVNDSVAIAVYYWLLKRGVRVPQDIAVAGVDALGPRFHPFQLTTVDVGLETIGRSAAEMLLEQMDRGPGTAHQRKIKPALVISASTRRDAIAAT